MATTVNIIIRGVAICYKKLQSDGRTFWRVLFPFDDEKCHKVNYSWCEDDGPPQDITSLAQPSGLITVDVTGATTPPTSCSVSNNFRYVLDMTNTLADKPITHRKINLKSTWQEGTVLLKVNAPVSLSVVEYMIDPNVPIPKLHKYQGGTSTWTELRNPVGHTVKATIKTEGTVRITCANLVNRTFTSGNFTITLDNDCKGTREGMNDMDMFYDETIVDEDNDAIRFIVGDRAEKDDPKSIPVDLDDGKPCLVVEVSDPDGLPD